jgi:ribosome-associated translation inhibitor RaiA
MMTSQPDVEVLVQARGEVSKAERAYAHDKVEHLLRRVKRPVLFARVDLNLHADPAREHGAFAKAELDLNGRVVRAHVAAATMFEAVDLLEARLRERLERVEHHQEAKHLRMRGNDEHQWRHGDPAASRSPYFPRPVEERELVRHKTFGVGEMTPDEAVADLELLDHDFYLFRNRETHEDNVIARSGELDYELFEPSATSSLAGSGTTIRHSPIRPPAIEPEDAIDLLNLGDLPFVFFLDPETGQGRLLYRRYDGHYGLVTRADEAG